MLDISNLKNSVNEFALTLDRAMQVENDSEGIEDFEYRFSRNAAIHTFEIAYECAWKLMKKWLEVNVGVGVSGVNFRRNLFRLAAEYEIIDDPQAWWNIHEGRNKTAHMYDQTVAEEMYQLSKEFLPLVKLFVSVLEGGL